MPKELKLAGITGVEAANAFIREIYLPAHNARFAVEPAHAGSAFVPIQGVELDEILCLQEERQVINDNCVSYRTLKTADPREPDAAPLRQGAGQGPCLSRRLARPLPRAPLHWPLRRERKAQARQSRSRRLNALGGAQTLVEMWTTLRLAQKADKENITRTSGHMMRYQNRTTSFATDGECQRFVQKSYVSILYGQSREEDSMYRPEGRIRRCLGSFGIIWPAAGGARATG